MKRRDFAKLGLAAGAMIPLQSLLARKAYGLVAQGIPLPGNQIAQFVDPLPELDIIAGATQIQLEMREFAAPVMPSTFLPGVYPGTTVWGYRQAAWGTTGPSTLGPATTYINPVIIAQRGTPIEVKYVNHLGSTPTGIPAWDTSTDQTLHWADPLDTGHSMVNYAGPVPAVPHLHGGEVPPELDGGPDAWFTSDGNYVGHAYYSKDGTGAKNYCIYRYPNSQEAANIWFHDHALGITRLNVYAGLAGAYIITDGAAGIPTNLPPLIPLVIQDRMFDTTGQLFFPNIPINPEHPFWIPEFVGDTIVVNGKVWPYKAVDRQRYRMLFLNGSNARAYDMSLQDRTTGVKGPPMYVIGTDGGYLDAPVPIDPNATGQQVKAGTSKSLVAMPGERYEVIVDFNDPTWVANITAAYGGNVPPVLNLELQNTARTPFPDGGPAPKGTTGRVMQFRVNWNNTPADGSYDPSTLVALRSPAVIRLVDPVAGTPAVAYQKRRQLTLNEVMGPGGPLEVLVNNTKWGGHSVATDIYPGGVRPDFTPAANYPGATGMDVTYYSERPQEGQTELWEIINLTADAHPIHLHLVQFQLMNRQVFDIKGYTAAYDALFPASSAIDPMTGMPFPGGMFIGGFGPPLDYNNPNPDGAVGGNPAVTPFLNARRGAPVPPLAHERGWKDTVVMYPGQVTRIMVRWAPTDLAAGTPSADAAASFPFSPDGGHGYVWHCHIIDHEDNEMMRPDKVTPNLARTTRDYVKGADY
jgi:spore coat protein A